VPSDQDRVRIVRCYGRRRRLRTQGGLTMSTSALGVANQSPSRVGGFFVWNFFLASLQEQYTFSIFYFMLHKISEESLALGSPARAHPRFSQSFLHGKTPSFPDPFLPLSGTKVRKNSPKGVLFLTLRPLRGLPCFL